VRKRPAHEDNTTHANKQQHEKQISESPVGHKKLSYFFFALFSALAATRITLVARF
jgi:hypothetical protein